MSRTWYIIDKRDGAIINACEGDNLNEASCLRGMSEPEHLMATPTPSPLQLADYRYWRERP